IKELNMVLIVALLQENYFRQYFFQHFYSPSTKVRSGIFYFQDTKPIVVQANHYFVSEWISFLEAELSLASLNSFTPFPKPRIRSGIFRPPKNKRMTTKIMISSVPPGIPIRKVVRKLFNIGRILI